METSEERPAAVAKLESIYGPESQSGFGGAVFWRPASADALEIYRHFVGERWDRFGEAAWMGPWRKVGERAGSGEPGIVDLVRSIEDPEARRAAPLVLEPGADAAEAASALTAAFDADTVRRVEIYNIGDGEAMSGLLVAALRDDHLLALVALMD